jgi:hypothetical protein
MRTPSGAPELSSFVPTGQTTSYQRCFSIGRSAVQIVSFGPWIGGSHDSRVYTDGGGTQSGQGSTIRQLKPWSTYSAQAARGSSLPDGPSGESRSF